MRVATRIVSIVLLQLLLAFAVARNAGAAESKEAVDKLKTLSQSASAAYGDGDFEKTKTQLQEAMALARENNLGSNKVMAQIYILVGVVKINEQKDTETGIKYFAKALDINPAAKVPPTMATKAVKAAFAKAEDVDPSTVSDPAEGEESSSSKKPSKKEAAAAAAEQEKQDKAAAASAAADERKRAAEERKQAADEKKRVAEEKKQAADERKRNDAE